MAYLLLKKEGEGEATPASDGFGFGEDIEDRRKQRSDQKRTKLRAGDRFKLIQHFKSFRAFQGTNGRLAPAPELLVRSGRGLQVFFSSFRISPRDRVE